MIISVSELRTHMSQYLDRLEEGEEVTIIRHSVVIGRLVPSDEIKAAAEARRLQVPASLKLPDTREVHFRQYGMYENPDPIQRLHQLALEEAGAYVEDPSLDADLLSPGNYYQNWGGEFWVGELDGEIVAMGAFRLHLSSEAGEPDQFKQAAGSRPGELKRMRVRPDLQGQGIGSAVLDLLESRAKQHGYDGLVLDTVADTPAQAFYERHGYKETARQPTENFELVYYHKEL